MYVFVCILFSKPHLASEIMASIFFCIFITITLPSLVTGQNNGTVGIGASLTAGDDKVSPWLSPSGDFAFGFQQLPDDKDFFLLAIWFNKVPEKTVVWHAETTNNVPAPKWSKLLLTTDRGLVLTDPRNQKLWNTDPIISQVDFAILNDTGNFVLASRNSEKIWESFKNPTDTLLPAQRLERGDVVFARQSSTNFSHGRFELSLLEDGNLVLNSINWPSKYANEDYYRSGTDAHSNSSSPGLRLEFNESGPLYILLENNEILMLSDRKERGLIKDYYYRTL